MLIQDNEVIFLRMYYEPFIFLLGLPSSLARARARARFLRSFSPPRRCEILIFHLGFPGRPMRTGAGKAGKFFLTTLARQRVFAHG